MITAFFAVVVGLSLAEVAVRIFNPQISVFAGRGIFLLDEDLGHRVRPNLPDEGSNSIGFRDREFSLKKEEDAFRIAVIGDSFTFGIVEKADVFPKVLERELTDGGFPFPIEVMNCGVPAYNTHQEIGHYKKFVAQFSPDLVILGFFIGGDILENGEPTWFRVVDGELTDPQDAPGRLARMFFWSHAYRLLRGFFSSQVHAQEGTEETETNKEPDDWSPGFLAIENARASVCDKDPHGNVRRGFRATEKAILTFAKELEEDGVRLLVLLIPDEVQVSDDLFSRVMEEFSGNPEDYDRDGPNKRLGSLLEENKIPVVDPLEELRDRHRVEPVYKFGDTHWNRLGNEIAGKALSEPVKKIIRSRR